jgi:hypothetical protein
MKATLLRAAGTAALSGLILATAALAQVPPPRRTPITRPAPAKPAPAAPATTTKFVPKFEALAETRLLMEGLAYSNYRSLQRLLKDKPADNDTWVFARGQALLVAETGNLLLLRPPRNTGRETWMKLAMTMRDQAGNLARKVAARDHAASKAALEQLTTACNNCHQRFRIDVRVGPEQPPMAPADDSR